MGAKIMVDTQNATIIGVEQLTGAVVKATDLRAGAALVIAGLAASGITEVRGVHYIKRGYDSLVEKLQGVGADISEEPLGDSTPETNLKAN